MLSDVSIGIKTFLRDSKMLHAVKGILHTMPEAHMIIADDGEMYEAKEELYARLAQMGHKIILCPFDSGFGYKSNRIAEALARPYLLVGSDDFDFSPPNVRVGIEKMVGVLDRTPFLSIASGRVDGNPYECYLSCIGSVVYEVAPDDVIVKDCFVSDEARQCHLTVNYSLIRREVFNKVRWDDDVKIGGGEHGAFFYDVLNAGLNVGWVPDVNINAQIGVDSKEYNKFRRRACRPERECFKKRGITKWVLADGTVDYEEKP